MQLEDSNYVLPCEIGPICRKPGNFFNIFHLNCQGLNSSYSFIEDLANISVFQVIALTETWLNVHNSELLGLEGYNFYTKNRQLCQHLGLAVYIRSDIEVTIRSDLTIYREMVFESLVLHLCFGDYSCYSIVPYRPPTSS